MLSLAVSCWPHVNYKQTHMHYNPHTKHTNKNTHSLEGRGWSREIK